MDTNTIFSWNGFTVFQELHWQRHLRFLWNTATCEGSTPTCYSSLSHQHPHSIPYSLLPSQKAHGDSAVRARPSAPATHSSLPSLPYSLPYRRARARQPRTPPSPLLPTPYSNGRPLQSGHALSSSPSSLLPTLQAHPSAPATHSSLPSSPYSLLETCIHGIPCADSSLTASPCSSRRFLANVKSFMSLAARSTALP